MKRISKRVREEAALCCAIAACEPATVAGLGLGSVHTEMGFDNDSWDLAYSAWLHAFSALPTNKSYELACAEAEAMLRTGWSPWR